MAEEKYIPQKLKIVITIVNRGKGEFFLDQMETMGINMQVSLEGEGTAHHNIAHFWGLAHNDKDVIISFVPEDKIKKVLKRLDEKFETVRNGNGVAFVIPVSSIIGVSLYQFLMDNRKKKELKRNGK